MRLSLLVTMLSMLLVLAAFQFRAGYWDTWEDKKSEIKAELDEMLSADLAPKVKELIRDCVSDAIIEIAVDLDCEVSKTNHLGAVGKCIAENNMGQKLNVKFIIGCMDKIQAELDRGI